MSVRCPQDHRLADRKLTYAERAVLETPVRRDSLQRERFMPNKVDLLVEPLDIFLKALKVTPLLVVRSNCVPRYGCG